MPVPDALDALFDAPPTPSPQTTPAAGAGDALDALFATPAARSGAPAAQPRRAAAYDPDQAGMRALPQEPPSSYPLEAPGGFGDDEPFDPDAPSPWERMKGSVADAGSGIAGFFSDVGKAKEASVAGLARGVTGAADALRIPTSVGQERSVRLAEADAAAQDAEAALPAGPVAGVSKFAFDLAPWMMGPGGIALAATGAGGGRRLDVLDRLTDGDPTAATGGPEAMADTAGALDAALAFAVPKAVHRFLGSTAGRAGNAIEDYLVEKVGARVAAALGGGAEHAITGAPTGAGLAQGSALVSDLTGDHERAAAERASSVEQAGVLGALGLLTGGAGAGARGRPRAPSDATYARDAALESLDPSQAQMRVVPPPPPTAADAVPAGLGAGRDTLPPARADELPPDPLHGNPYTRAEAERVIADWLAADPHQEETRRMLAPSSQETTRRVAAPATAAESANASDVPDEATGARGRAAGAAGGEDQPGAVPALREPERGDAPPVVRPADGDRVAVPPVPPDGAPAERPGAAPALAGGLTEAPGEPPPGMPDDLKKGLTLLAMERQHLDAVSTPGARVRPFGQDRTATVVRSEGTGADATVHLRFDDTGHEAGFAAGDLDVAADVPHSRIANGERKSDPSGQVTPTSEPSLAEVVGAGESPLREPEPLAPRSDAGFVPRAKDPAVRDQTSLLEPDESVSSETPFQRQRFRAEIAKALGITHDELVKRITSGPTPINRADFGEADWKAWQKRLVKENPIEPGTMFEAIRTGEDNAPASPTEAKPALRIPAGPKAHHDIIDQVIERGGIRPKPRRPVGGEYDDAPRLTGKARRAMGGTEAPDVMAKALLDDGVGDGSVRTLWRLMDEAHRARRGPSPEEEAAAGTAPHDPAPAEAPRELSDADRSLAEEVEAHSFSRERVPGEGETPPADDSGPIVDAGERHFTGGNREMHEQALTWARENLVGTKVENNATGWDIRFTTNGVQHALAKARGVSAFEAVPALPQMLQRAELSSSEPGKSGKPDVVAAHRFTSMLRTGGRLYRVKMTVLEHQGRGRSFYEHSLTEVEPVEGTMGGEPSGPDSPSTPTGPTREPTAPPAADNARPERPAQPGGDQAAPERVPGDGTATATAEPRPAKELERPAESGVKKPAPDSTTDVQAAADRARLDNDQAGRLPIAPLPADEEPGSVRPLRESINDLADWLGATVYAPNRKMPRGAGGYYSPASGAMVLRRAADLDTVAHETGHWIADAFSLLANHQSVAVRGEAGAEEIAASSAQEAQAAAFDHELSKFWPYGSEPPKSLNEADALNYRRDEGLAEYLRAWMVNPEAARAAAPMFAAHVEAKVPADVMKRLGAFGEDVRRFHHAPPVEAGAANIRELGDTGQLGMARAILDRMPVKLGGRVRDQVHQPLRFGFRDWLRYRFTNRLNPLVKAIRWASARGENEAGGKRAERLIQLLGGQNDRMNAVAQHGMIRADWLKDGKVQRAEGVGGGIDWMMGWVDARSEATVAADLKALDSYMVAQRTIEQADHIDRERSDLVARQMAEIAAAYQDAKESLEETAQELRGRAEKQAGRFTPAGDKLAEIKTDAKEMASEGKKAAGRGSEARERIAKRADAISRAVLRASESVRSGTEHIGKDAEKQITRLHAAVEQQYARKVAQLGRVAKRLEVRDRARKARLSGQGGGTRPDDEQARRIIASITEDPLRRTRLDEGAKRYRAWANGVLRYLVDKGRLSQEQYDAITARNQQYVAMNRIREDGVEGAFRPVSGGKPGVAKAVVQSFKGSQREVENPLVNLVESTQRSIAEADRNEAMRSVVDLLREARRMHQGESPDLAAVGQKVEAGEPGAVKVFRNGAEESWKFAPQIMEAVKGLGEQYRLPPILTVLPRMLHAGVINNPAFAVTNRLRDIQHRLIAGQSAPRGALEAMKRLKDQIPVVGTHFDEQQKLITQLAGGAFTGHYMRGKENWHRELAKRSKQLAGDHNVILATGAKALGAYRHLLESSEFSGRLDEFWPVYDRLRKNGVPEIEAAEMAAKASRDIVDFAQAGTWMAVVNQLVPFTNAAVQGLRATGNAFLRDKAGFTARWALLAAAPAIATYALAALRGDKDLEEYRNLPAWRRDLFYNVKIGANTWLTIPKPFEIGVLASGAERGVETAHRVANGEDIDKARAEAYSGFGGSMARGLLPVDEKSMALAFSPFIETFLANRNFYTGREIVPSYEADLPVDQRKGAAHASRLGLFGQWLSGNHLDARQVDNLISGTFGGVGGLAMTASDLGRSDKSTGPLDVAKRMVGVVRQGAGADQQDVQRFTTEEREQGRAHGKPIQAIQQMTAEYWKATTGAERDAMAAAMRDYVEGRDPLMAFDRAVTVANQLESAMRALPPAERPAFAKAHGPELGRAQMLTRASSSLAAAKRNGVPAEKLREMARRIMAAAQSAGGESP